MLQPVPDGVPVAARLMLKPVKLLISVLYEYLCIWDGSSGTIRFALQKWAEDLLK